MTPDNNTPNPSPFSQMKIGAAPRDQAAEEHGVPSSNGYSSAYVSFDDGEVFNDGHGIPPGPDYHPESGPFDGVYAKGYGHAISIHEASDDDVVVVPGVGPMSLASARANGWAPGVRQQGSQPASEQPQLQVEPQPRPEAAAPHPDLVVEPTGDATTDENLAYLDEAVPVDTRVAVVEDIVSNGEVSAESLEAMARELGAPSEGVAESFTRMQAVLTRQADQAISEAVGINDAAVVAAAKEWMRATKPAETDAAIRRHLMQRQSSGYSSLAAEFMEGLDKIAPQYIPIGPVGDTGGSIERDYDGRYVVRMPDGRSYGWGSAVRAGLVKFT